MSYPTKHVPLSRQALIQEHGRLLQDSGCIKRVSTPTTYADLAHTFTNRLGVSYYQSPTGRVLWYSGRPATQSIPRTVDPSTLAPVLRDILFMQRFGRTREEMSTALQKTSSQLSKLESRVPQQDTRLWAPPLDSTLFPFCSGRQFGRSTFGLILMQLARMQGVPLPSSFVSWASILSQSPQTETPSATVSGKSGVL